MVRKSDMPRYACPVHGTYRPPHPPRRDDCDGCMAAYGRDRKQQVVSSRRMSTGSASGGGRSSSRKGRRGADEVAKMLLRSAPSLTRTDIRIPHTNKPGEDLAFTGTGRARFPFCVEIKFTESLNIWAAIRQAERYRPVGIRPSERLPLVFFRRAHSPVYVAVPAEVFLAALACKYGDVPPGLLTSADGPASGSRSTSEEPLPPTGDTGQ
jgi:hypothetical protein